MNQIMNTLRETNTLMQGGQSFAGKNSRTFQGPP